MTDTRDLSLSFSPPARHRQGTVSLVLSSRPSASAHRWQRSDTLVLQPSRSSDTSANPIDHRDIEGRLALVERDPYMFKGSLKTKEQLGELRRRKKAGKNLERFHREQNDLISSLLKSMEEHTEDAREVEETNRLPVKIAIWASMISNVVLCILQMYGAISSASLSLIATGIDSVFDVGSNVVLLWLHRKANALDINKWPVGGSRLQTIGNIVYGSLSVTFSVTFSVNLVVIVESVRSIISHNPDDDLKGFHIPSLIAVGAALGSSSDSSLSQPISEHTAKKASSTSAAQIRGHQKLGEEHALVKLRERATTDNEILEDFGVCSDSFLEEDRNCRRKFRKSVNSGFQEFLQGTGHRSSFSELKNEVANNAGSSKRKRGPNNIDLPGIRKKSKHDSVMATDANNCLATSSGIMEQASPPIPMDQKEISFDKSTAVESGQKVANEQYEYERAEREKLLQTENTILKKRLEEMRMDQVKAAAVSAREIESLKEQAADLVRERASER
ncbi:hypothetical protein EW145_g1262 [Phellinidium pouzarii]|uniref:Cation efflux protein transmembrane domain-containing protein n=1 Tax=Phellinidium pouzarii TaxID=167371 RepID=A0A4S4LF62_9AGAM|nr:hypothetical protein EW145_g1262 [Phellinidium pouzarii]